jgi:DNA (cytosine-5)-methyltransferase 1
MKHIGLFEGIGGFSLAARWAGWETIAWCEWNEFGQKVLRHHFPKAKGHGDITQTDFTIYRGQCDIVTGGFPCQPYSTAGKRLGKEDERHLWPAMLRAIREIQPRWVVGENVLGLVNWSGGLVFHEVQADLEAAGYEVFPYVLPACAVNAPHRRDRVWFVAYSKRNGYNGNEIPENRQQSATRGEAWSKSSSSIESWIIANPDLPRLQAKGEQPTSTAQDAGTRNMRSRWERFPTQSPVCSGDDGLPTRMDGITFSKWRNESIKAYGNAIVPQVAYEIFQAINQYEESAK